MPKLTRHRKRLHVLSTGILLVIFGLQIFATNFVISPKTKYHLNTLHQQIDTFEALPDFQSDQTVDQKTPPPDAPHSHFLLRPDLCSRRDVTLAVCVHSARSNFLNRHAIRATWHDYARQKNASAVLAFFIGVAPVGEDAWIAGNISREFGLYQDIIQDDFVDSYYNLSRKSLSNIHWVTRYCNNTRFYLKVDDDAYVDVLRLIDLLMNTTQLHPDEYFILGGAGGGMNAKPIRNKISKWYVSEELFNETVYPPYVMGGSYAMTISAAFAIQRASAQLPVFFIEDIYVTGLCRRLTNVQLVRDRRISNLHFKVEKKRITGMNHKPGELVKIHQQILNMTNVT